MKEVIQRLEMIKNAIMLEDEDIIELQVTKLAQLTLDHDAKIILTLLRSGSFEAVIGLIETYRQSKMGLISYEDNEVYGLRLELKTLETEYEDLNLEKINLDTLINDFNAQYYHKCGKLIEEILLYRSKIQQQRSQESPDDQEKAEAFEEAKRDYDDFHKDYLENVDERPIELSEKDSSALKAAYRKASRLCHPDKVSDEFKAQAAEVFKQLSEAYRSKDLKAVTDILNSLENQKGFSIFSDTVSSAEKLRRRIIEVKEKISSLSQAIAITKEDEAYQTIDAIGDWNHYFTDIKASLSIELTKLQSSAEASERA
jgi:hypothetical protein